MSSSGVIEADQVTTWRSNGNDWSPSTDSSLLHYVLKAVNHLISSYSNSLYPTFSVQHQIAMSGQDLVSLELFTGQLVRSANISATTLISALVYVRRLVSHPRDTNICPATSHSIFLAALIVATKFLYDRPRPGRNKKWTKYCGFEQVYGINTADVNRAERQLLEDLSWKVALTERDVYEEFENFELSCWMPAAEHRLSKATFNATPKSVKLASRLPKKCVRSASWQPQVL